METLFSQCTPSSSHTKRNLYGVYLWGHGAKDCFVRCNLPWKIIWVISSALWVISRAKMDDEHVFGWCVFLLFDNFFVLLFWFFFCAWKSGFSLLFHLTQWFLTLLEVLNPTSSMLAFIEPFVVAKIKCVSWILFYLISLLKISYRRTPETDSSNPWRSIEPRLRTTDLTRRISI